MRRTWPVWFAFAVCLAIVLSALGWVSLTALELDEAEAKARHQADLEENVRLALWRIDSTLTPLLAQESARPYFAYRAFSPGSQASAAPRFVESVSSPPPAITSPFVIAHFQFDPDGQLTSPNLPQAGSSSPVASAPLPSTEEIDRIRRQLDRVRRLTNRSQLANILAATPSRPVQVTVALPAPQSETRLAVRGTATQPSPLASSVADNRPKAGRPDPLRFRSSGLDRAAREFQLRSQAIANHGQAMIVSQVQNLVFNSNISQGNGTQAPAAVGLGVFDTIPPTLSLVPDIQVIHGAGTVNMLNGGNPQLTVPLGQTNYSSTDSWPSQVNNRVSAESFGTNGSGSTSNVLASGMEPPPAMTLPSLPGIPLSIVNPKISLFYSSNPSALSSNGLTENGSSDSSLFGNGNNPTSRKIVTDNIGNLTPNAVTATPSTNYFGFEITSTQTLPAPSPSELGGALMTPLWIEGQLMLVRQISVGGCDYFQGCLLDWPAIKTWLLETVGDLLPQADLVPVTGEPNADQARMLAALPLRLIPGPPTPGHTDPPSPIRWILPIAWACVLAAAAVVAALLALVVRLGQRRADFVSAVTHELRTPLTTFHMYTEMLAEGMVPDPERQRTYLQTLRSEAARLSHLVENVLAFARLERRRTNGLASVSIATLLHCRERLAERCVQVGMELVIAADENTLARNVRANPSVVEQILMNLVDNACKYACQAEDKRITIAVEPGPHGILLKVCDHGPGLPRHAARKLFWPFSKSATEATNSAPGIGLGLALSRRLARDAGARLWHSPTPIGTTFVLSLPRA